MFKIEFSKFGKYDLISLKNIQTKEKVSLVPDIGATIIELFLQKNNQLHSIMDTYKTVEEIEK